MIYLLPFPPKSFVKKERESAGIGGSGAVSRFCFYDELLVFHHQ
jgi:hypothetical protein